MEQHLQSARDRLVEALGSQSAFWGLGKITGQLFAALYLSEKPLSLTELAGSLGVTKGNVSIAIRSLEHMGMVRRSIRPGDRRVFFEAESDFWLIARRVLERRQKPEFDMSFKMVDDSLRHVRQSPPGPDREFMQRRLEEMQKFYKALDQIVEIILRLEPGHLAGMLRSLPGAGPGDE